MKKNSVIYLLGLFVFSILLRPALAEKKWVSDELLVQFENQMWVQPKDKEIFFVSELENLNSELKQIFKNYGVYKIKIQFNVDEVIYKLSSKRTLAQMQEIRKGLNSLRYRYLLYVKNEKNLGELKSALDQFSELKKTSYNEFLYPSVSPSDTSYSTQWALPYMEAESAWDISTDASNVNVAVVDGGFQEDHADLIGNVFLAWDSVHGDTDPTSGFSECDDHGTHVAGIIGAVGNNSQGISGTFWTGNLMLYQMGDTSDPDCPVSSSVSEDAIADAVGDGANIINRSYGYNSWIEDDIAGNSSVLFIHAAGNDGKDLDSDSTSVTLSAKDNFIFVANIESDGEIRSSSNFGVSTVHVAAPGTDIYSTVPTDGYDYKTGTSMAAPYVAGVAALAWSQCSLLTASQIKDLILDQVTLDTTNLGSFVITQGYVNLVDTVNGAINLCDSDGDGHDLTDGDCDDTDASVYPGAIEVCSDSIDQDCDGDDLNCDDVDNDGDGQTETEGDCRDSDSAIYSGAEEICSDGIDQDCNGSDLDCADVDNDGDGQTENEGDCDDTDISVYTGAIEECDGQDDDCDGIIDPDCDNDGDGLTKTEELAIGTDPEDADSDDDSLNDGDEVNTHGTNPLSSDTDSDLLTDSEEVTHSSCLDPLSSSDGYSGDEDGEGLSNGDEIRTYGTNPCSSDSDSDGLTDKEETDHSCLNPLNSSDGYSVDTDADTLVNGDEIRTHLTDPCDGDTDDDELSDGEEITTYGTDPNDADTDNDALSDGEEVLTYTTDPLKKDTDNDSWKDGEEVSASFSKDPLVFDNLISPSQNHDFNGDGYSDLVAFGNSGTYCVIQSMGSRFSHKGAWIEDLGDSTSIPVIGDFDADGLGDVASFKIDGTIVVGLSDGMQFVDDGSYTVTGLTVFNEMEIITGDFNGDGKDDIAVISESEIQILHTGTKTFTYSNTLSVAGYESILAADYNGDGEDDIAVISEGTINISLSASSDLEEWLDGFTNPAHQSFTGDFNGDGLDDIWVYNEEAGSIELALSWGDVFIDEGVITTGISEDHTEMMTGDFTGDGYIDMMGYTGKKYWRYSEEEMYQGTSRVFTDIGTWKINGSFKKITECQGDPPTLNIPDLPRFPVMGH